MHLAPSQITDDSLRLPTAAPNLSTLRLDNCFITDGGLKYLIEMPQLRNVYLRWNRGITDDGLAWLRSAENIESADIEGTRVTLAGLRQLEGHPGLRRLWVSRGDTTIAQSMFPDLQINPPNAVR
jgi:hypothetical protein